jgi:uncharacterized protein
MPMPGLEFRPRGRRAAPSPVHSDVAGFIGRTRRGPVGEAIRVEGWRRFVRLFGDLDPGLTFTYAVRGYFENGGKVAYIVRVAGDTQERASHEWIAPQTKQRYRIRASSPGNWGKAIRVSWDWRSGRGQLVVAAPQERTEYHANLNAEIRREEENVGRGLTLESRLYLDSDLIELVELKELPQSTLVAEPTRDGVITLRLTQDVDERPTVAEYLAAVQTLGDVPEVALLAVPGLYDDFGDANDRDMNGRNTIWTALLQQAYELQDRLVLLDPPNESADKVRSVVQAWQNKNQGNLRSGAVYGPWLRVSDPHGGMAQPLRKVPPSGHVAGIISRLDRERGAHHTPANVSLLDAVDIETRLRPEEENDLNETGVNLIRCQPGRGLMVWGGRTLDPEPGARFVAHRRLIHRLVRAIRRVSEPITFDGNTPALWLAFTRAITTVLLEAYRAGALQGDRPDDAFQVECNEKTNPASEQDLGRVICLISLAPATPMEFITLRVALSEDKQVEVFDA